MLVLTRKYQEKIRIGDNITITVLRTKGKAVRLGIEAPTNVPVIRGELSFEPQVEEVEEPSATLAFASAEAPKHRSESATVATSKSWNAANRPHPIDRALTAEVEPQVSLTRVARSKPGNRLAKAVPGSAPLRAIMNERCGL